jgi:hypothetical protein
VEGGGQKPITKLLRGNLKIAKEPKKLTEEHRKVIDEAGANFTLLYEGIYAKSAIPRQEVCYCNGDLMLPD